MQRALDANPAAQRFFATLTGSTRYAFLYRLHHVSTAGGAGQADRVLHRAAERRADSELTRARK